MADGVSNLRSMRGAPRMARLKKRVDLIRLAKKFEPLKSWSKEHVQAASGLSKGHLDVLSSLEPDQVRLLASFSPEYIQRVKSLDPDEFKTHMAVLQGLDFQEVTSLGRVPSRFRFPYLRGLPEMVAWDLARWKNQEKPPMASGALQVRYGLEKGGEEDVPSTGGDSSDLIPLNRRNIFFTMLDFSGKGASANEPKGMFQGFLRGHLSAARNSLKSLRSEISKVMRLNHAIDTRYLDKVLLSVCNSAERTHNQHFPAVNAQGLTGYFQLRPKERQVSFRYVHMGHEPLFVLRRQSNGSYQLEEHGLNENGQSLGRWFGMMADFTGPFRRIHEIQLGVGDKLVTYTDGLSESRDKAGNFFGHERVQDLLLANAHESAETLTKILKDAREAHQDTVKYKPDDMRIRVFEVAHRLFKPERPTPKPRWKSTLKKEGGWPQSQRKEYRVQARRAA